MSKQNKVFYERPNPSNISNSDKRKQDSHIIQDEDVRSKAKELIINVILVVVSIAFGLILLTTIGELADMDYTYTRDEDMFWYSIKDGEYGDIVYDAYHNQNEGVELTPGLEQCYAVARYFEAASLYKAAVHVGDTEDIEKYVAVMEECLTYMDDILYIAEDINMTFGIEQCWFYK